MRKTLILIVGFIILLAGIVGYIVGTAPDKLTGKSLTNLAENLTLTSDQNSTADGAGKTESGDLPALDSLLITAETTPLPLSLRAGIFFDEKTANASALQITEYGYPATVQQFSSQDQSVLHLVVLAPFKNEANLQLAKYELFKQHGIVTQRIITPTKKEPAAK